VFTVRVQDYAPKSGPFSVVIDDQQTETLSVEANWDLYYDIAVEVEIFDSIGGRLLDARSVGPICTGFEFPLVENTYLLAFDSGQLCWTDSSCKGPHAEGTTDIFCDQQICRPSTAADGAGSCEHRCGLALALDPPAALQVKCAPPGTKALGESCEFGEPASDNFDNCQNGTGCIAGACRAFCYLTDKDRCSDHPGTQCVVPDELAWTDRLGYSLGVCMP
jgi:hypothetical protein